MSGFTGRILRPARGQDSVSPFLKNDLPVTPYQVTMIERNMEGVYSDGTEQRQSNERAPEGSSSKAWAPQDQQAQVEQGRQDGGVDPLE